jgi:inner membrane protein
MPSPVGHALAGISAGWLVDRPGTVARTVVFGLAGIAADVDLLFGAHSGPTHGLGAAVIAGMLAAAVLSLRLRTEAMRSAKEGAILFCGAVTAAYASHTLLDWLGTDSSPPIGIMALWPFSRDYYESHLHVFRAISRRYWLPEFWASNARALAGELAILLPLAALVFFARRRPTRSESNLDV